MDCDWLRKLVIVLLMLSGVCFVIDCVILVFCILVKVLIVFELNSGLVSFVWCMFFNIMLVNIVLNCLFVLLRLFFDFSWLVFVEILVVVVMVGVVEGVVMLVIG